MEFANALILLLILIPTSIAKNVKTLYSSALNVIMLIHALLVRQELTEVLKMVNVYVTQAIILTQIWFANYALLSKDVFNAKVKKNVQSVIRV